MARSGKRMGIALGSIDKSKEYEIAAGVKLVKENAKAKFDETIELSMNLGVDPRHADQNVRGVIDLPNGTGKSIRVGVFAKGDKAEEAINAGADVVGADDLADEVQKGKINFDRCIATPDMMPVVGKLGKILGPRGMMPNPKLGTVTNNIKSSVKALKSGQIEIKNDEDGNVGTSIGKKTFPDNKLKENYNSVIETLLKEKPTGIKGEFILSAYLTSTMGLSYKIKLSK